MRKIMAMSLGCGLVLASAASATPVARQADLTLTLTFRGLGGISVSATGATVMVDDSGGLGGAGQIAVAAGAIALATPVVIPVTSSTAVTQMGTTSPSGSRMALVTPTCVLVPGNLLPVTSKLEIHFVPEPGRFVLLVAGLAGFAAAARRRV